MFFCIKKDTITSKIISKLYDQTLVEELKVKEKEWKGNKDDDIHKQRSTLKF